MQPSSFHPVPWHPSAAQPARPSFSSAWGATIAALTLALSAATSAQAAPANDDFANAITFNTPSGSTMGVNVDATVQPGEPSSGVGGGRTVWWRWTAPSSGCMFVDTAGSSFDTVLCVFRGTTLADLVNVGSCNDDSGGTLQSRVEFSAVSGTNYWIQVDGYGTETGDITLNWGPDVTSPSNDDFANGIPIGGASGSVIGNNCSATAEAGEPAHAGRTVWWRWVAPDNGRFFFRTGGSSFDTLLCIYQGETLVGLAGQGCNDDAKPNNASRVDFCAQAGQAYWVRLDGYQGAQGDIVLTWGQVSTRPSNDNFLGAIALTGTSGTANGYNQCAGAEPGEPLDPRGGGHTVWWCWTAPDTGCYFFNTVGSSFDTVMCAYRHDGGDLAALTQVGDCSDDFSGKGLASRVEFRASAGTTYWFQVDGFGNGAGDITLNWGADATPPVNDNFAAAIDLSEAAGIAHGNNCNATEESASGEPANEGRTVWWRWTAPASGCAWFTTKGSDFDTLLCIFTGATLNGLSQVACADDSQGKGLQTRLEINATAGTVYWIRVDGFNGQSGTVRLSWASGGPPNDNFAGATVLGPGGTVTGQNRCTTAEAGEPLPGGSGRTVWYQWTPTTGGCAFLSTRGSSFDTVLSVFTGASVNGLTPVASNDDSVGKGRQSRVEFVAAAGVTYSIQVDGFSGQEGDIVLAWGADPTPPENDDFAAAVLLTGDGGTVSGNNCAATLEPGEPVSFGGDHTIWYRWTAPTNACFFFNTVGSPLDTVLCVFTGTNVASLTQVGCEDDSPGKGFQSRVEFAARAGTNYWIQVSGFSGLAGNVTLNWGPDSTPPANDAFAAATVVSGNSGRVTGNTCFATGEAGEPDHNGTTVWWRWVAPADGCAWISTLGSGFDTVSCVYTGASVNGLIPMGCNDDAAGKGLASRVEFIAFAGTTYFFRVDSFDGAFGDYNLQWGYGPPNDNFANATSLGAFGTVKGNNRCATLEAGEPALNPGGGSTIWYRWTAPNTGCGRHFFSSRGSSFDTYVCVFTGGALNTLTTVACNDDFPDKGVQSRVEFDVTPGTDYFIRVDGYDDDEGDITLTWGPAGPPPANDHFAAATVLTGASGSASGENCAATMEPGEPANPPGGGRTVWYCWTAPSSDCVYFGTLGSAFDTVLCVFTGDSLKGLTQIGCNDDTAGKGLASRVNFHAQAGQRYWIQVDGFLGSHGSISLNWGADTTRPANDDFLAATSIFGPQGSILGRNCNATAEDEGGEPANAGRTVWYQWTAPLSARVAFRTVGSSFDTVVCVFTGASLDTLTAVTCADDSPGKGLQTRVEFDATAGTPYWIRVDGFFGAVGNLQLSWGCWPGNFRVSKVHDLIAISWDGADFTLQGTSELGPGGSTWTDIPGRSPVILPATGPARFFRLRCEEPEP